VISSEEKTLLKKKFNLGEKVVLYVGMLENRKNIFTIIKIADMFSNFREDMTFVLVGKIGYGGKEIKNEITKRNNLIHLMNIDDETLSILYNISDVFLFPSLYEGFGYPPLEAMQSGLPVIASDNTSLREIISDGGILCNPNDFNFIFEQINRLIDDKEYWNKFRNAGLERAKNFTLENSVKQTIEIFNSFDNYKN
jgi:glycosyltransferase involved in cell wall biosynthesis